MVLQREDDGHPAGLARDLSEAAQQVLVASVHPVEDADGHGGILGVPLFCELAIVLHVRLPRRPRFPNGGV